MKNFFLTVLAFSFLTTFILAGENFGEKKVFCASTLSDAEKELLSNFRMLSVKDQNKFTKQVKRIASRNTQQEEKDLEFPSEDLLLFGL